MKFLIRKQHRKKSMTQQINVERLILVTGATGNQGGAVARHLLQRGNFKVRAFVRDPNKPAAQALQQAGAELVVGEFSDRASLDRALQGAYGVFSIQTFLKDGLEAEIRDGKTVADAAKAAGIQHFVYSSVGSAERNTGIPHFDSKFQVEEYIRSLGLPYTMMRPVFFFYNYNTMRPMVEAGTLSQPLSLETKLQQLSEEDYGEMVAEVFDRPTDFLNREEEVASVDMTMPEIAAASSRVLGKTVNYQQIPFEAFEQQAGEEVTIMYRWLENVGYGADLAQLKRDFPAPTDFESYLRDHNWAKPAES
ncbi:MAG: NmrA/HSCARG family protein [Nostoc sp.]|uniref:NmrA/HSCARG family protein n=1 Tax=Nostoc sp. TaxID=1180 RepID=UPI002FF63261